MVSTGFGISMRVYFGLAVRGVLYWGRLVWCLEWRAPQFRWAL